MTNSTLVIVSSLIVLVIIVSFISRIYTFIRYKKTGRDLIDDWSKKDGLQLIQCEYSFSGGPFALRKSWGQYVYRIIVRDQQGLERHGWILAMPFPGDRLKVTPLSGIQIKI